MGDPLSISASIVAVLQLTGSVVQYLNDVKGAPKDRQRILTELSSVSGVLFLLRDLSERPQYGDAWLTTMRSLNVPKGPLEQFKIGLEQLASKLAPVDGLKKVGKALIWPFQKTEIQDILGMIERQKSLFNLAMQNDHVELSRAIRGDITSLHDNVDDVRKRIAQLQIDEHHDKIIEWLSTTDPSINHHAACKKHQPTTGEWLIKRADFEVTLAEEHVLKSSLAPATFKNLHLFATTSEQEYTLNRPPPSGCGKTVLSSTIIEHMKVYCDSKPSLAIAYFYFDFNDTEKQTAHNCISSLIAQLCSQVESLPEELKYFHKKSNDGKQKPTLDNLKVVLTLFAVTKELHDIFIVADALDECPRSREGELRAELLELITEINAWPSSNIHLLVTSRPEQDIKETLAPLLTTPAISLQGSQVGSDIKLHIRSQLSTDPKLKTWSSEEKAEIEETLTAGANGMFRWVFCQLDTLKKCKKRSALCKALKSLPRTLDDTYARILINIDEEDQQEARRALLWLAFSQRPLYIKEVAEAAVIDPQLNPPFDPKERLRDPYSDILEILGSLASSLFSQEYLVSERILNGEASRFGASAIFANHFIGETCLLYILHYDESNSKAESTKDLECFPLLQYASKFWYIHVKSIPTERQEKINPVIFRLFLSDTALLSWLKVHRPDQPQREPFQMQKPTGSPLYYASDIGLEAVVRLLLETQKDIDSETSEGKTALYQAAFRGHEAVVRLPIKAKADVNVKTSEGKTALYRAAFRGHEAVVQLLLEAKADVNSKSPDGKTALYWAASEGHKEVVQLLLEAKVDVNAKSGRYETALYKAAESGHEAVVQQLLEAKADVNTKTRLFNETALYQAARNGHKAVVQLLLEAKADVNAETYHTVTALYRAAENGHEAVVRLLLEAGANVNAKTGYYNRTALYEAANNGHEAVVRLLLQAKAGVDARAANEWTALCQAAVGGHEAVVRLLLSAKADVNAKTSDGETALQWAARGGHKAVVQLLLEAMADVNIKSSTGRTALYWAAFNGHEAVVRLPLEAKADVNAKTELGDTALSEAATKGHRAVVRLVLEAMADGNAKASEGDTFSGLEAVVPRPRSSSHPSS